MRVLATLVAGLSLAASGSALAQPGQGIVMGVVFDPSSGPLPGAPVVVTGVGQSRGDTTEFDGRFVIGRLAPGAYRVRASYPGYALAKPQTVTVAAGQRTFVRIRLNREEIPPILLRK